MLVNKRSPLNSSLASSLTAMLMGTFDAFKKTGKFIVGKKFINYISFVISCYIINQKFKVFERSNGKINIGVFLKFSKS